MHCALVLFLKTLTYGIQMHRCFACSCTLQITLHIICIKFLNFDELDREGILWAVPIFSPFDPLNAITWAAPPLSDNSLKISLRSPLEPCQSWTFILGLIRNIVISVEMDKGKRKRHLFARLSPGGVIQCIGEKLLKDDKSEIVRLSKIIDNKKCSKMDPKMR